MHTTKCQQIQPKHRESSQKDKHCRENDVAKAEESGVSMVQLFVKFKTKFDQNEKQAAKQDERAAKQDGRAAKQEEKANRRDDEAAKRAANQTRRTSQANHKLIDIPRNMDMWYGG